MFIETLEFTIPVDLCDLFTTLKDGNRSNMEFPASVNSYGTTQDASIQVALRANKLTFVVEGVSSQASMISKSECKTLKLSVFDVDRTLIAQECTVTQSFTMEPPSPVSYPSKRPREYTPSQSPRMKSSRTEYSPVPSPAQNNSQQKSHHSNNSQSRTQPSSQNDNPVNVKQEPEDPDLIEIEPDDIEPKKEEPFMQIDYSSDVPHTQTSSSDRLSFPQRSHSSSYQQNVPHVPEYSQSSQSHHGDQSADDFLVFQDDNDYGDNDNSADYSNDDASGNPNLNPIQFSLGQIAVPQIELSQTLQGQNQGHPSGRKPYKCPHCEREFSYQCKRKYHVQAIHEKLIYHCACGKQYHYKKSLARHQKMCPVFIQMKT